MLSRHEYELKENTEFYWEVLNDIDNFNDFFKRIILINFRKLGIGLSRWAHYHPSLVRKIRMLEHKLLGKQRPKYDERYD